MTLTNFQDLLHSAYQGDTSTPSSGTDDWNLRLNLLLGAIAAWDNEQGMMWPELWTMLSDASDGDKTGVASTTDYDCPTNFRFAGGFVRMENSSGDSTYYDVVPIAKSELFRNETVNLTWFTGNKNTGFDLHFNSAPTVGETIEYPYYKEPFEPSTSAHVIEMSDPWFAVYWSLAKLHENDGEGDRAALALAQADARLRNMRTRAVMSPNYQYNYVPDREMELGTGGFGK